MPPSSRNSTTRAGTPLALSSNSLQHPTNHHHQASSSSTTPQPKVTFRIASANAPKISSSSSFSKTNSKSNSNNFDDSNAESSSSSFKKNRSFSSNTFSPPPSSPTTYGIQSKIRGPVIQFGPSGGPSAEFARLRQMADLKTVKNQEVFPPLRNPSYEAVQTNYTSPATFSKEKKQNPPLPWSSFNTPKMREEERKSGVSIFGNKHSLDDSMLFFGRKNAMNNNDTTLNNTTTTGSMRSTNNNLGVFKVPKMKDVLDNARSQGKENVKKRRAAAKLYQEQNPDVFLFNNVNRKKDRLDEMDFGFDTAQEELERTIAEEVQRAKQEVLKEEEEKRAARLRQEKGGHFGGGMSTRRRSSATAAVVVDVFDEASASKSPNNNNKAQQEQSRFTPSTFVTPVKDLFAKALQRRNVLSSNSKNNNSSSATKSPNNSKTAWTKAHENNTNRELLSQAQRQIKMEAEAKKNDSVTKTSPMRNRMVGVSIGRTKRRTFLTDAQLAAVTNSAQSEVIASPAKLLFQNERKEGDDNDAADREFDKRRQAGTTATKMNQKRFHPYAKSFGANNNSSSQTQNQNSSFVSSTSGEDFRSPSPSRVFHHPPPATPYNPSSFSSPMKLNTNFTNRQKVTEFTKENCPFTRQGARRSETEHAKLEKLAARLLSPEHLQRTIQRSIQDEDENAWFRDFAADVDIDDGGASKRLKHKQHQDEMEEAWKNHQEEKKLRARQRANQDDDDNEQEESSTTPMMVGSVSNSLRKTKHNNNNSNKRSVFFSTNTSNKKKRKDGDDIIYDDEEEEEHKNAFTQYFDEMNPEEDPDQDLKAYGTFSSPERLERMAARELRNNLDVRRDDVSNFSTTYKVVDKNPKGLTSFFAGVDRDYGNRKSLMSEDPYQWEAKKLSKMYPHH